MAKFCASETGTTLEQSFVLRAVNAGIRTLEPPKDVRREPGQGPDDWRVAFSIEPRC
jgi:hypothetical protein